VDSPLITADQIKKPLITHKLFIDLSVPRSISPSIEERSGVILYNIDEIDQITDDVREARKKAISNVELIRDESIDQFIDWSKQFSISPVIQKFKKALEEIRREELKRYLKKASEQESELLNEVTDQIMQKVIKLPVLQLKAACQRGEAETMIDTLNELFNLDMKQSQAMEHK
jgi:glutamyl-tRNA reductase